MPFTVHTFHPFCPPWAGHTMQPSFRGRLDRSTVDALVRVGLGVGLLALVVWLTTALPGADRYVPGDPLGVEAVLGAVVAVAIAVGLIYLAPALGGIAAASVRQPASVAEDVASIVTWATVLLALLLAHRGVEPVAATLSPWRLWWYDLGFLLVSVPVLVVIALRLYRLIDPMAAYLTEGLLRSQN